MNEWMQELINECLAVSIIKVVDRAKITARVKWLLKNRQKYFKKLSYNQIKTKNIYTKIGWRILLVLNWYINENKTLKFKNNSKKELNGPASTHEAKIQEESSRSTKIRNQRRQACLRGLADLGVF